ncbi:SprT-like zinc ribbon domain containing protein [uncultured Caudovirales phage]|uniref:SprT-like zinc ribbon domain containing protein n=1 Tax=uncultured Caudovirales phage TaxID=2100421 RepID=A0A6J5KJE6_9CAUD|nr:SprT-like zinc ribbon domain containing protein [uncultured Caudovirales phage]CAB5170207.1 SprT-like zinc ribbon domain containing protein [uncultured Caudovirales phage]
MTKPTEDRGKCRCGGCGEQFQRLSTFDRHRTGPYIDRRCLTVVEMSAKGWRLNQAGRWIGQARWPGPDSKVAE